MDIRGRIGSSVTKQVEPRGQNEDFDGVEGFYKPDSSAKVQKLALEQPEIDDDDEQMNEILASLQEKEPRSTLSHRGQNERKADEVLGVTDAKDVLPTGLSPHSRNDVPPQESGPIADSDTKQVQAFLMQHSRGFDLSRRMGDTLSSLKKPRKEGAGRYSRERTEAYIANMQTSVPLDQLNKQLDH